MMNFIPIFECIYPGIMKKTRLLLSALLCAATLSAQYPYQATDPADPIYFDGKTVIYHTDTITLGPRTFFIDGSLPDTISRVYPYVYTSVQEAVGHLTPGTAETPMKLYFAPWVYWVDDPDDPSVRRPQQGSTPYGLIVRCDDLHLKGLTDDPSKVVLAGNRGQTMGAVGNFTLFYFDSDEVTCENLTLGNYCNVDLDYPLRPELNRSRRGSAIVQAQLAICNSDRVFCRNVRFISRLNLCNFAGAGRALFLGCHMECTDDALCGTGVYKDCTLEFYAPRPFGHTEGNGAVFLHCDITSMSRGTQYFVKSRGPVAAIDTHIHGEHVRDCNWRDFPLREERYYHAGLRFNGSPCPMGSNSPETSIDLTGKPLLDAYRIVVGRDTIYNLYNLLRGDDDWDPCHTREQIVAVGKRLQRDLTDIPTKMWIAPTRETIETGQEGITLFATAARPGCKPRAIGQLSWSLSPEDSAYVRITPSPDKSSCRVESIHDRDEVREVAVTASSPEGLCAAAIVHARPRTLPAPAFVDKPRIVYENGILLLHYTLDSEREDLSSVTWYRCSDKSGRNAIPAAASNLGKPLRSYRLSAGDKGCYLMAAVTPRNIRCKPGEEYRVIYGPVKSRRITDDASSLTTDFSTLPTTQQLKLLPGFWTLDGYKPTDTQDYDWTVDNTQDHWYYGHGVNGAREGLGLVQSRVGARLRYTPVGDRFGDMKVELVASPAKTAGQGFASARQQYLDLFIKFDHATLSGYALRLIRTTKYGDAIDFLFVKYDHGTVTPIGEPVTSSCFRTPCRITLEATGQRLRATAHTDATYYVLPGRPEVKLSVEMETEIEPNDFGGVGVQHTGTVDGGATQLNFLRVEWE